MYLTSVFLLLPRSYADGKKLFERALLHFFVQLRPKSKLLVLEQLLYCQTLKSNVLLYNAE